MKILSVIIVCAFAHVTLTSRVVFAQGPEITPVKKGEQAPFTGLLVPEARYIELLEAEMERDNLKVKLRLEMKYITDLELFLTTKLKEAAKSPAWYETASFNRWFGFTLGIIVTGAAIWGGVEVVNAANAR